MTQHAGGQDGPQVNAVEQLSDDLKSGMSVREELEKDREFMSAFEEYVKYEKMINDYAMTMHLKQYEQLKK